MKIKESLKELVSYKVEEVVTGIKLDANETENYLFNGGYKLDYNFSRYPNSNSDELRIALANKYSLSKDNFIIGNGSTELLELTVKTFCGDKDTVLSFDPSFSMYKIYATLAGAKFASVPIETNGIMDLKVLKEKAIEVNPKIIFICNPNNPTGSTLKRSEILEFIQNVDSLVIVDEAYMEFYDESESLSKDVLNIPNLMVARTFSKAYGLASFRVGYIIANEDMVNTLLRVKLPYSVNSASTSIAIAALSQNDEVKRFIDERISIRDEVINKISNLGYKVYPSKANFIFFKGYETLQEQLIEKDILIRKFKDNFYRLSVGSKYEMEKVVNALKELTI